MNKMNNYKGFIDDLIGALRQYQAKFVIIKKTYNNQLHYTIAFDKPEEKCVYEPNVNEIRYFTDDILFGLQGKIPLPNVKIIGYSEYTNTHMFLVNLFGKVHNSKNRDYLFDIFLKNTPIMKLIKSVFNHPPNNEDKTVIEDIISYLLDKEIQNSCKDLNNFKEILRLVRKDNKYDYLSYKGEMLELFKVYEPYINANYETKGVQHESITYDPRNEIALLIKNKDSPTNYNEYRPYLPIAEILNKPQEQLFAAPSFQMVSFDLSYTHLIQNNESLISHKEVEESIQDIINSINSYLYYNNFKDLKQIGQLKLFNTSEYKTSIWFNIDKKAVDIEDTIKSSQYLFTQLINYHNTVTLQDSVDISVDEALRKSIQKFALECIVTEKAETTVIKKKI